MLACINILNSRLKVSLRKGRYNIIFLIQSKVIMPSPKDFMSAYIKPYMDFNARLEGDHEELTKLAELLQSSKPDLYDIQEDLRRFQSNYDKLIQHIRSNPIYETTYEKFNENKKLINSLKTTINRLIHSDASKTLTNFFDKIYGMHMPYRENEQETQVIINGRNYRQFR